MSSNEVKVGALTLGGIGLLAGIITFCRCAASCKNDRTIYSSRR